MSRRSSTASSRSAGRAAPGARVLHLDAFSGIAGNMFLGAMLWTCAFPGGVGLQAKPLGMVAEQPAAAAVERGGP